jgi:Flp pilus assembly pilin Flp
MRDQRGATAVEYLVLVGVLALSGVVAFTAFGGAVEGAFLGGDAASPGGSPRAPSSADVGGAAAALGGDSAGGFGATTLGGSRRFGPGHTADPFDAETESLGADSRRRPGADDVDPDAEAIGAADAVATLLDHFDEVSNGGRTFDREDLERIADDPSAPDELREAARYLLDHETVRNAVDVGAGRGSVDGDISREDLEGALDDLAALDEGDATAGIHGELDTLEEARSVLDHYDVLTDTASGGGGRDGFASVEDLIAIVEDESLPPELRLAALIVLEQDPPEQSCSGFSLCHLGGVGDWLGDRWDDFHDLRDWGQGLVREGLHQLSTAADAGLGWGVERLRDLEEWAHDLPVIGPVAGQWAGNLRWFGEFTHGGVNATLGMVEAVYGIATFLEDLALADPDAIAAVSSFAEMAWNDPGAAWDLTYEVGRMMVTDTIDSVVGCATGDAYACGEFAPDIAAAVLTGGSAAVATRASRVAAFFGRRGDDIASAARRIAQRFARSGDNLLDHRAWRGQFPGYRNAADAPAFGAAGRPLPEHVRQGMIGDCYLLASCEAVARANPDVIRNAVQVTDDGFTVRFWERADTPNPTEFVPRDVAVPAEFPARFGGRRGYLAAQPGPDGATWPLATERAYAQVHGGYRAIGNGGYPHDALSAITGRPSHLRWSDNVDLDALDAMIREGHAVVVTTRSRPRPWNLPERWQRWRSHVVSNHAYSLESVDRAAGTVTISNPWGSHVPDVTLTYDDFVQHTSYISHASTTAPNVPTTPP